MMTAHVATLPADTSKGQFKGWHALLWFIGFFGFMFAVNGIFLWTAITTFPGEDVEKSYMIGVDYNQEIARRDLQTEAGWVAEIGLTREGSGLNVRARLSEADGKPLSAASISLQLRHPADRALDRTLELVPVASGEYSAPIENLAPGTWKALLSADVDPESAGNEFKASRNLFIP